MGMKDQLSRMLGLSDRGQSQEEVKQLPVESIVSSPYQPRSVFNDDRLEELSQTIRVHGMIQPIVVRKQVHVYEIIAGERRWRAVKKLGLGHIPAIIREMTDSQAASVALIEN